MHRTNSGNSSELNYMKQLDGLRALAVLAVLYTHYLPSAYWPLNVYWGEYGVQLFFVLSGFLITTILLKCRQNIASKSVTASFTLRRFYIRRFLRIFPLYYAVLIFLALLNISPVRETLIWHIPYLSNVYFFLRGDWHGSVSHLWSLAVEEQFYLIWPFLILCLPQKLLLPTIVIFISSAPTFRLISTIAGLNQFATWVLAPSCFDTLGLGSLLAYLSFQKENLFVSKEKFVNLCLLFGIFMQVVLITLQRINNIDYLVNTLDYTSKGLIFTWLIAKAACGFKGFTGKFLETKSIMYIGKISYGIYLIHNFTPDLIRKGLNAVGLAHHGSVPFVAITSTIITLLLATISWHFFEKPINNLKSFFPYTLKGSVTQ